MTSAGSKSKEQAAIAEPQAAFGDALATWNEQFKARQQQVQEYQRTALENLAKSQEAFAQQVASFAESGKSTDWAAYWEQVSQNVDEAFDFAVELLNRQRAYTKSVVDAAAGSAPSTK